MAFIKVEKASVQIVLYRGFLFTEQQSMWKARQRSRRNMKILALQGRGLTPYVSQNMRDNYDNKL